MIIDPRPLIPNLLDFPPESLVAPRTSLLGVRVVDGAFLPTERLGPGIVREVDSEGNLLVHWTEADADAYLDPSDLQPLGDDARLVLIIRLDAQDKKISSRHKIVTSAGLGIDHNWTVELRPRNVIRAIRSDGCAWTLDWNPIFARMTFRHNADFPPPRTDDAEALTVAELALS